MITGAQILAARKLLGWPRDRLAPKASITMLKRIERLRRAAISLAYPEGRALSAWEAITGERLINWLWPNCAPPPQGSPAPPSRRLAAAHNPSAHLDQRRPGRSHPG